MRRLILALLVAAPVLLPALVPAVSAQVPPALQQEVRGTATATPEELLASAGDAAEGTAAK